MDSPVPSDPYAALGLTKDAQAGEIKSAYRKLVLRCHPDKITDQAQKAKAVEEFHKVQQAYELISDEERRGRYDAMVRLAELRRQTLETRSPTMPRTDFRTAAYDVRTAAPPPGAFAARGPARTFTTDERRPAYYSDEDNSRASARKSPHDYAYVRRAPPERERDAERTRRDEDRKRAERRRDVDREADRSTKYAQPSKEDDFARAEESRRRRDREEKESSRSSPLRREGTAERMARDVEDAQNYMSSKTRPDMSRTTSSRDIPYSYVRRSAAETRDRRSARETSPRDSRGRGPEIVDPTRPGGLRSHDSDPAGLASATQRSRDKPEPHRSYTTQTNFDRRQENDDAPPFIFSRSQTMPTQQNPSSSSRKPAQPSKMRTSGTVPDSGYSSPATPERAYPPPPPGPPPAASSTRTTQYHYPDPMASSKSSASKDYNTIFREPTALSSNTGARRVPSPARERSSKSSTTASMMANLASATAPRATPSRSSSYATYDPATIGRSAPRDDRDRSRRERYRDEPTNRGKLYGEVPSEYPPRDPRSRTTFSPEDVQYARRISPEDVSYSSRSSKDSRSSSYYNERPSRLSRQGTAVY